MPSRAHLFSAMVFWASDSPHARTFASINDVRLNEALLLRSRLAATAGLPRDVSDRACGQRLRERCTADPRTRFIFRTYCITTASAALPTGCAQLLLACTVPMRWSVAASTFSFRACPPFHPIFGGVFEHPRACPACASTSASARANSVCMWMTRQSLMNRPVSANERRPSSNDHRHLHAPTIVRCRCFPLSEVFTTNETREGTERV